MADQLFYGKLSGVTPIGSGSNSYVRVRGDFDTSSKTITNVIDVATYLNIDYVKPGQTLLATGPFTSGTTVVSVDTGAATITVADFPAATTADVLTRISPADGEYYIASASFYDPNLAEPISFKNITGSDDSEYNGSTPIYAVLGSAATPGGTQIAGRFHLYSITDVFYRNASGGEGSIYISWAETGTQASSGDELYENPSQVAGIVSLTTSESLAPIFATNIGGISDLPAGSNFAPYQIAAAKFL
jgi:hypothetical protein